MLEWIFHGNLCRTIGPLTLHSQEIVKYFCLSSGPQIFLNQKSIDMVTYEDYLSWILLELTSVDGLGFPILS